MALQYIEAIGVYSEESIEFIVDVFDKVTYGLGKDDLENFCIGDLKYIKRDADNDWVETPDNVVAIDPDDIVLRYEMVKSYSSFPESLTLGNRLNMNGERYL